MLTINCIHCGRKFDAHNFKGLVRSFTDHMTRKHPVEIGTFQVKVTQYIEDISLMCLLEEFDVPKGVNEPTTTEELRILHEAAEGRIAELLDLDIDDGDDTGDEDGDDGDGEDGDEDPDEDEDLDPDGEETEDESKVVDIKPVPA